MADALTIEDRIRRFLRRNECKSEHGTWTVFSDLFFEEDEDELSFHLRPGEWTDETVSQYRLDYSQPHTIPGVVQLGIAVFQQASMPLPTLQEDDSDLPQYRHLHCSWPCPSSRERADQFADLATTALAGDGKVARVVFDREKIKKSKS